MRKPNEIKIFQRSKLYTKNKMAHSQIFCGSITTKMLFQHLTQCKKNYCLLPRQRYWHAEACLCIIKPGQHLNAQNYSYKILSLRGGKKIMFSKKKVEKLLLVVLPSSLHANSCCWNLYSKINKRKQISCWDWCKSTISICPAMSTDPYTC